MSSQKYDSRTADKFVLRLPEGMRPLLRQDAAESDRSTNSHIVAIIKRHMEQQGLSPKSTAPVGASRFWVPVIGMLVDAVGGDGKVHRGTIGKFLNGNSVVVQRLSNGYCDDVHLSKVKPAHFIV